jgi:UDP-galactopyranose mutase
MSRFARERRVFFWEEPVADTQSPFATVSMSDGVHVIAPHIAPGMTERGIIREQRKQLADVLRHYAIDTFIAWFYAPLALPLLSYEIPVAGVVFDCMDDGAMFRNARAKIRERQLIAWAEVVFTADVRLFEAKRLLHPNVHLVPSSDEADGWNRTYDAMRAHVDEISARASAAGSHRLLRLRPAGSTPPVTAA